MTATSTNLPRQNACAAYLFIGLVVLQIQLLPGQTIAPKGLCSEVVTLLVPQLVFKVPTSTLERVEVRKCLPGVSDSLQIAAWERDSVKPSLVIVTDDFTIVQAAMIGRVFLIETTGGPRDLIYLIVYESGKPRLALKAVSKDRAQIISAGDKIAIKVTRTNGKVEHLSFKWDR